MVVKKQEMGMDMNIWALVHVCVQCWGRVTHQHGRADVGGRGAHPQVLDDVVTVCVVWVDTGDRIDVYTWRDAIVVFVWWVRGMSRRLSLVNKEKEAVVTSSRL